MKYTAGQAATATGVSKATITRALKSGKISGQKDDTGAWVIDPAELHRVFPPISATQNETRNVQQSATPYETPDFNALQRENEMLREALNDARQERDRWHEIADRLSLAPPSRPRRSWWRWS